MSEDLDLVLATALAAARAGGALALARLYDSGYQQWKGPRDLLVGAVLDVQTLIVDTIREVFPNHHFLVEESKDEQDTEADPLWIIDPIDGTLNYAMRLPFFAVSIAYREAGSHKIGVVYDPSRDEMFHAVIGGVAYLNGEPILADKFSEGWEAFAAAVVGTDWGGDQAAVRRAMQIVRFMAPQILQVRVLGAPSLGLCYVAAGRLHAYYALEQVKHWDVAAGALILKGAGGIITNIEGASWLFAPNGYLASNDVIHGSIGRVIQPFLELHRQSQAKPDGE